MLFLCYPKCSTCQKARKWLDEHGIKYTERHIVEKNPTYDELKVWYQQSGLPIKKFFNTSGLVYKEMQLKDKLTSMSEEEQLMLLATHGMLVKRPMMITHDIVLVGFKEGCRQDQCHLCKGNCRAHPGNPRLLPRMEPAFTRRHGRLQQLRSLLPQLDQARDIHHHRGQPHLGGRGNRRQALHEELRYRPLHGRDYRDFLAVSDGSRAYDFLHHSLCSGNLLQPR